MRVFYRLMSSPFWLFAMTKWSPLQPGGSDLANFAPTTITMEGVVFSIEGTVRKTTWCGKIKK